MAEWLTLPKVTGGAILIAVATFLGTGFVLSAEQSLSSTRAWYMSLNVLTGTSPAIFEEELVAANVGASALPMLVALRTISWVALPSVLFVLLVWCLNQAQRAREERAKRILADYRSSLAEGGIDAKTASTLVDMLAVYLGIKKYDGSTEDGRE